MEEYLRSATDYTISPEGALILIGDLHGSLDRLQDLLPRLQSEVTKKLGESSWAHATLAFMGDYVDKGAQSRALLDRLVGLRGTLLPGQQAVFLMGNHDFSLMAFLGLIPRGRLDQPHPQCGELGNAFDTKYYESRGESLWRSDRECECEKSSDLNSQNSQSNRNNDTNDNSFDKMSVCNDMCVNERESNPNSNPDSSDSSSDSAKKKNNTECCGSASKKTVPASKKTIDTEKEKGRKGEAGIDAGRVEEEVEMHIQGRRYGVPESFFTVVPTFESYGCARVSRAALLSNMPAEHKEFFRALPMMSVLHVPGRGHVVCVHAGLAERSPAREQMELMRAGNCGVSWIEQISGTDSVRTPPRELQRPDVLVASGHHAILSVADYPSRVIVDTSEAEYLSAFVVPPKSVIDRMTKREIEKVMDIDFSDDQVFSEDDLRYGSFLVQSARIPIAKK